MKADIIQQTKATAGSSSTWHTMGTDQVLDLLHVNSETGLTAQEAKQRLVTHGPNVIQRQKRRSPWRILAGQFSDFMIIVLVAAAVVSGLVGELQDATAIIVIIFLNALIGFAQDYRAEKAMAALRRLAAPTARVRREGQIITIKTSELVCGDIVLLEAGNLVPADLRLLEAAQLQLNESVLTGESQPVEKISKPLVSAEYALGDRNNMVFNGTLVNKGRGTGVVTATSMQTELGKIASLLQKEDTTRTPLQKRLARFGKILSIAILAISFIIFLTGLLRGVPTVLMFLTAVSLAVAAIPEALPAVVTISLALGARKMVKQNALIRSLPAVETLGSVTYICSDKTGTLTENKMHLEVIWNNDHLFKDITTSEQLQAIPEVFYKALALNNDVMENDKGEIVGDPTEIALYVAAKNAGFDKVSLSNSTPRIAEFAFDAERKRMTTLHRDGDNIIAFIKGAPENIFPLCKDTLAETKTIPFEKKNITEQSDRLAAQGYRMMACAYRYFNTQPSKQEVDKIESDLTFIGLIGLIDPPRAEVFDAVALCKTAGITPVMITGDHPATALAIAKRLEIAEPDTQVLTGEQLDRLSETEFKGMADTIRVYARVTPKQKITIVKALQERGEYVAMTGDGVNDAPALKRADIGVAMGRGGTDVAREASQLILLDDNFATIVSAVREGRRIFDNIRKFIKYTMTSNSGEIWTLFLAPFLGLPIPLLPIHILYINLVTDGLPGLALALEPGEPGLMRRNPRPPDESIFAHGMWQHMLWVGLFIGAVSLFTQAWAYYTGSAHWQTMVFTTLTLAQLAHVMAIRSEKDSLFTIGITTNLMLLGAVLLTVLLQIVIIYTPFMQSVFRTQPLSFGELLLCFLLSLMVFFVVEIEKWMIRRGWLYQN